jgi:hypothetical protein
MKIAKLVEMWPAPDETLARFSRARLIRKANGAHELIGGSKSEQRLARSWCESFAPFVGFEDGLNATEHGEGHGDRIQQVQREMLGFEVAFLRAYEAL